MLLFIIRLSSPLVTTYLQCCYLRSSLLSFKAFLHFLRLKMLFLVTVMICIRRSLEMEENFVQA
jgi:hypothetical protein